jgi:hypothetical protein
MMKVSEVKRWLETLSPDDYEGVDEGGLCLQQLQENQVDSAYLEIGGLSEEE